jgi:hypothetical protein
MNGLQGLAGLQGPSASSSSSGSFFGATGTVNIGTGVTGTDLTYGIVRQLYSVFPVSSNASYEVVDTVISSATTDIFTVPTGKKAALLRYTLNNQSGAITTFYSAIKINDTYIRLDALINTTTNSHQISGDTRMIIFNEGESFAIVSTQTSNIRVVVAYTVFDATVPIFTIIKNSDWSIGENVLYTNNDYKLVTAPTLTGLYTNQPIYIVNSSGSSISYQLYNIPSNGSYSDLYKIQSSLVPVTTIATPTAIVYLANGSTLSISSTSDSSSQTVFATLFGIN